jgi:hypothetical protein
MAICRIIETGVPPEDYEKVRAAVGVGDSVPSGGQLHIAAVGEDGNVRVIEVWDTREQAEAFGERVREARERAGVGSGEMPPITYLDVHRLVKS